MSEAKTDVVRLLSVRKSFVRGSESTIALRDVNMVIRKGEFVTLMGKSGSGKSTLLNIVGGLERPDAGEVRIGGQEVATLSDAELARFRCNHLGYIFQFFNLLPTLTALENVALPRLLDGQPLASVEPRARELLKLMELDHRADHKPHQLSGGEMQRVAIARALISNPSLILADEPTGALDTKTGTRVLELLQRLAREGQTILMVTHDPKASSYGTRRAQMQDGELIESND